MKKSIFTALALTFVLAGTGHADTGEAVNRRIVWDKDFSDQARLENAKVGERLSVRANQNFLTRNWNVQSLG